MSHEKTMSAKIISGLDMEAVCEICKDFEQYQQLCRSLYEFAIYPDTTINGSTVPFYILKQLAYNQKKLANIENPAVTKFVAAIADTACLLGTFPHRPGGVWEASMTEPTKMFDDDDIANLKLSGDLQHATKTITSVIEKHILSSIQNLVRAVEGFYRACASGKKLNIRLVLENLKSIDAAAIADDVIDRASTTYYEKVHQHKKTPKCLRARSRNTRKQCKSGIDGLIFSKNFSGFRLKISGITDADKPIPGFFDTRSDLRIMCKIGLLGGTVGFGWIRKSAFSREKTWSFFVRPPTC